jgi:arylsulfatase A-like enzyme
MVSTTLREDTDIVVGIRTEDYKYFRLYLDSKKQVHLFNLKNDPNEITNIADSNPNIISEMENKLKDFERNSVNDKTIKMDNKDIDKVQAELKKLGYI